MVRGVGLVLLAAFFAAPANGVRQEATDADLANPLVRRVALLAMPENPARQEAKDGDAVDPLRNILPEAKANPNVNEASDDEKKLHINEERILAFQSLINQQAELREEEQLEVHCASNGMRESSEYDAEQINEALQEQNVRLWTPTNAEHRCLSPALRNKFVPGKLLGLPDDQVAVPAFPERLGELVIEAISHFDKVADAPKHILLEVKGCTSCENDLTDTVEWAGLLPINEAGELRGVFSSTEGDAVTELVESKTSADEFPRKFSYEKTSKEDQRYVKQHTYKYSSYHFDSKVMPEALELAKKAVVTKMVAANSEHPEEHGKSDDKPKVDLTDRALDLAKDAVKEKMVGAKGVDSSFLGDQPFLQKTETPKVHKEATLIDAHFLEGHREAALRLMEDLKGQVKHIPFNHKMEQLHMLIRTCDLHDDHLDCSDQPEEGFILHDGGLVVSSSRSLLFDELGRSTGEQCQYGPCLEDPAEKFTMCSKCGGRQCPSTRAELEEGLDERNYFNCLVGRTYTAAGYEDRLASTGQGLFYRGTLSPGHVQGHINWHVSIPAKQHCEPVLQDAVYFGIGVDEADRCSSQGRGGVDVDIGLILIGCVRDEEADTLGNAEKGSCKYVDHLNYKKRSPEGSADFYGISEDNRGGSGEGDDEWVFIDLAKAKSAGVTHAVVMGNVFGCQRPGLQGGPLHWNELEGAFMRVTASGKTKQQFTAAETISYVDLDEMKGNAAAGAAVFMLYLGGEDTLAVSKDVKDHRVDAAAAAHLAWRLVALKQPVPGRDMGRSFERVARWIYSGMIDTTEERSLEDQRAVMTLADAIATGQTIRGDEKGDLQALVKEGIEKTMQRPQPNEDEDEKAARTMTPDNFHTLFSAYLPEGAPGTDSFCMKQ